MMIIIKTDNYIFHVKVYVVQLWAKIINKDFKNK